MDSVLKDHPVGHKNMVSQAGGLFVTGSITLNLLQGEHGPSRPVFSHGSGLSRQVSLYCGPCMVRPATQPDKGGLKLKVTLKWRDIYISNRKLAELK